MASVISDWKPHLGRKVSLRYKIDDPDHPFSEAIGVVASVATEGDAQVVTILTRAGGSKNILSRDIVAAKIFPVS